MNEQRYILTIRNNNIFREIDLSQDVLSLKIGTTQDCTVRLKRELFDIPVCLSVWTVDDMWRLSCDESLFIETHSVRNCQETTVSHGDILKLYKTDTKQYLFSITFSYNFSENVSVYDSIVDIRNAKNIIIGNVPNANLLLKSKYIGAEYISLSRSNDGELVLDPSHALQSASLNGNRVFDPVAVREYDFIGIADYSFYYKNGVLYTANRQDGKSR